MEAPGQLLPSLPSPKSGAGSLVLDTAECLANEHVRSRPFLIMLCWSHTVANIWRMGLRMQFAINSQCSQSDRQTFLGVRKHSRSFVWCCEYSEHVPKIR